MKYILKYFDRPCKIKIEKLKFEQISIKEINSIKRFISRSFIYAFAEKRAPYRDCYLSR